MNLFVIVVGIIFALFSALVMSYISMATMVGPWIAPTLVLLGQILLKLFYDSRAKTLGTHKRTELLASMQAIGAGGGIIATGIGFALPTLYFLEPVTFNALIACPWYFCGIIAALCIVAGGFGLVLGKWWAPQFIDDQKLPFPVSQLTYNIITSQSNTGQAQRMLQGILGTTVICALRDGVGSMSSVIAKTYYLFPSVMHHEIGLMMMPAYWAIGFSVGLSVTMPLLIGMISKYLVLYPLAHHAQVLPFSLFQVPSPESLSIAFCSGIVLCELVVGLTGYGRTMYRWVIKRLKHDAGEWHIGVWLKNYFARTHISYKTVALCLPVLLSIVGLLSFFSFSPLVQILFVLFTMIATYFITKIGGEIGMIPFGRFSTFIILPLLIFFGINAVQVTVACVFFDICAATASDLLFDYKTGDLCAIDRHKIYRYQWIGLIATSLGIGLFLWLLFTNLQLGSDALFAQRSKAKSLLIQSLHFDLVLVGLGMMFGLLLKRFKINPTMVFGGLIMPNTLTISLLFGSIFTQFTKHAQAWQPLCAGILAAESLWVIMAIVVKIIFG